MNADGKPSEVSTKIGEKLIGIKKKCFEIMKAIRTCEIRDPILTIRPINESV